MKLYKRLKVLILNGLSYILQGTSKRNYDKHPDVLKENTHKRKAQFQGVAAPKKVPTSHQRKTGLKRFKLNAHEFRTSSYIKVFGYSILWTPLTFITEREHLIVPESSSYVNLYPSIIERIKNELPPNVLIFK